MADSSSSDAPPPVPKKGRQIQTGADYLEQFKRSPYHLPGKEYQGVEGTSTLGGSWQRSDK